MTIGGVQLMYQLNRANGHIDSDPLVVHTLMPTGRTRSPRFPPSAM